jgi:predicted MFS family arabinose efflux permease
VLKNPEPTSSQNVKEYLAGAWTRLKNIRVVSLFASGVLRFAIYYGAYLTYFTLLMGNSFGASSFTIGVIMSSMSLTTAVMASQLGRISKRLSLGSMIKIGFVIYALALFLIPLIRSLWLLLIPAVIFGIGHGMSGPGIISAVAELAPPEYRGAFMSLNSAMVRLGQTIGPPIMGLIYVTRGSDITFWAAASLALLVPGIITALGSRAKL